MHCNSEIQNLENMKKYFHILKCYRNFAFSMHFNENKVVAELLQRYLE